MMESEVGQNTGEEFGPGSPVSAEEEPEQLHTTSDKNVDLDSLVANGTLEGNEGEQLKAMITPRRAEANDAAEEGKEDFGETKGDDQ